MVFSSIIFLFLFLPIALILYFAVFVPYLTTKRPVFLKYANLVLFVESLVFYFWGEPWFICVILFSSILDYVCGFLIDYARSNQRFSVTTSRRLARAALIMSLVGNLTLLWFFKYFNFAANSIKYLMVNVFGMSHAAFNVIHVTLPLGISFYTFQTMSYTIDVYWGNVRATRNFIDYNCFVTMFPQLVAGPIVYYKDIAEQLVARTISLKKFGLGVKRFIIGLGKKVLIANTMATVADKAFAIPQNEITTMAAWIGVVSYSLQIYFDFSGYSDMAIGLGRMFGFEFL